MSIKSPSPATTDHGAMQIVCFMTLLCIFLSIILQSISSIMQRFQIGDESTEDVADGKILLNDDVCGRMSFSQSDEEKEERKRSAFQFDELENEFQRSGDVSVIVNEPADLMSFSHEKFVGDYDDESVSVSGRTPEHFVSLLRPDLMSFSDEKSVGDYDDESVSVAETKPEHSVSPLIHPDLMSFSDEKSVGDYDDESFSVARTRPEHSVTPLLLEDSQRPESESCNETGPTNEFQHVSNSSMTFSDEKCVGGSDNVVAVAENRTLIPEESHSPESESHDRLDSESDDDQFEVNIIQQHLQMIQKMKHDKKRALPTILEDSESPRVAEDMKPLILDKKIGHKDLVEHVHTFYKSYADKMLKLDILNQQTFHALSLIRLKGQARVELLDNEMMKQKKKKKLSVASALTGKFKRPKVTCDETAAAKPIRDLFSKLELIYVGQLCLSWEILNWQQRKAIELVQFDPHEFRHYNQVANEFREFQLMLRRFVEIEAFHVSSRVRRYVEKRAAFRQFLQVPLIKDDSLRDKKAKKAKGEPVVTISDLIRIIDESRIAFYKFLRADEQEGTKTFLQDQSNLDLFIEAQTKLQKKEKRVKELIRSKGQKGGKIRNSQEVTAMNQRLLLAQVELKLVAMVLSMSEISRDQILWCHKKLNEINFVDSGLYFEPTFLLFPF